MNLFRTLLLFPAMGILATSCVRSGEKECPPQLTVTIGVRDKNYKNVQELDPASYKDENLPLREYVGTLYYELARTGSTDVRKSSLTPAAQDKKTVLTFDGLTPGRYVLSVWGNAASDPGLLHSGTDEGTDLYLGSDTLDFTGEARSDELWLDRTKGKLKITYKNLPTSVVRIRHRAGPVYQRVAQDFTYSGSTTIEKTVPPAAFLEMLVAPGIPGQSAGLNIDFFTDADTDTPSYSTPEIPRTLERNGLSLVEIDYNGGNNSWEIWVTINGQWTLVHNGTIEENI